MPICVSFRLLQNQIIHDLGVKATLYIMSAFAIVAKNGGGEGYDFMLFDCVLGAKVLLSFVFLEIRLLRG